MGVNNLITKESLGLSGQLVMPLVVADTDAADLTDCFFPLSKPLACQCFSQ